LDFENKIPYSKNTCTEVLKTEVLNVNAKFGVRTLSNNGKFMISHYSAILTTQVQL
jgi:hypothetical protein